LVPQLGQFAVIGPELVAVIVYRCPRGREPFLDVVQCDTDLPIGIRPLAQRLVLQELCRSDVRAAIGSDASGVAGKEFEAALDAKNRGDNEAEEYASVRANRGKVKLLRDFG
jgi:hypothetical protein